MRHLAALALVLCCASAFAADAAPKDPNAGVVLDPAACEVWSTEKGTKYHTKDCPMAKVKTNLAAAVVDGDTACAKCSPPVYDPAKIVVFTSDSGTKYHLFSCRYAKNQTTLKDAVGKGLEPCAICKAPKLWTPPKADAPAADPAKADKPVDTKK